MQHTAFYATTKDENGKSHQFKVTGTDPVPAGHEITVLRPAERFPLTAFLSPADRAALELLRK